MNAMKFAPWSVFFRVESLRFIFAFFFLGALVSASADAVSAAENSSAAAHEHVAIAAAANFVYALDALTEAFHARETAVKVTVATGASGTLVAQIRGGAPYDIFLSADLDYPRALVASGDGNAASLTVFAVGRLVLWTTKPGVPLDSLNTAVRAPAVRKLAIANLETAPYGRAGRQALEALGLWQEVQPKLVMGENVTQTAQFVETGNADAGFVALSLVRSPKLAGRGRWLLVPATLHSPLEHGAVLTTRGETNPAAVRFLTFLRSDAAHEILTRFGYAIPK